MANELEAALDEAQKEKQILLDANAALQDELSSLREKQKSAELKVALQCVLITCLSAHSHEEQSCAEMFCSKRCFDLRSECTRAAVCATSAQSGQGCQIQRRSRDAMRDRNLCCA